MGNFLPSSHSSQPYNSVDNEKLLEKIQEALERKHLRVPNLNLSRVPRMLQSGEVKDELQENLKSLDMHGNPLIYLPFISIPNLTSLNLWGNNMTNEMFAPYPAPKKSTQRRRRTSTSKSYNIPRQDAITKGAFSGYPKLDCLDLGSNRLTSVPPSIANCTKLSQVTLSANFLSSADLEALADLSSLNILDLDLNALSDIPSICWEGKNQLFTLSVRGNLITIIPKELKSLNGLQNLCLADNLIEIIEEGSLETMTKLKNLYLFGNKLNSLYDGFFEPFENLAKILLQENQLTTIPSISNLSGLRVLNLSFNKLTSLPEFDGLTSLTQLDIAHNCLKEIPKSISNAFELRSLDLSYNELSVLPASMATLSHLSKLMLTGNYFTTGGKSADIITDIDENVEGLQVVWSLVKLELLYLGLNQIKDLPENAFQWLINLKTLNLSFNQITDDELPYFNVSPDAKPLAEGSSDPILSISSLFLNGNKLTCFPIEKLIPIKHSLSELAISGNQISIIPNEIIDFKSLKRLCLSYPYNDNDNDKFTLPSEIISLGLERLYIGSYFNCKLNDIGLKKSKDLFPNMICSDIYGCTGFPSFCSKDIIGKLKNLPFGSALCTGTSHSLEDCVRFESFKLEACASDFVEYVALFDGHGGNEIALFLQENLCKTLENYLRQSIKDEGLSFTNQGNSDEIITNVFTQAFYDTDKNVEEKIKKDNIFDKYIGSTAITLLVTEKILYCANVGDSRAVLATIVENDSSDNNNTITLESLRLSTDHKPAKREEAERVRKNGGILQASLSGTCSYRLTQPWGGPTLAVSRSFGDFHLRPALCVEPAVNCHTINKLDQFFVVASDGLWDVLTDKMCINIVARLLYHYSIELSIPMKKSCDIVATQIRDLVHSLGSNDDLSVIIVPLPTFNKDGNIEKFINSKESKN